jgi:hypothetical protein
LAFCLRIPTLAGGNGNNSSQLRQDNGDAHLLSVGSVSGGVADADFVRHWTLNYVIFICSLCSMFQYYLY